MYLGNPLLPVNSSVQETIAKVDKILKEKKWHEFQVATLKLSLVPYFLFNYHYFLEKEASGEKLISHSFDGVLSLDGHAIKIDEEMAPLIKDNWSKGSTAAPDMEFEEKWNNVDKKAQDSVIQLKLAQHFGVPKGNVVVTSIRRVLVPFYKASVTVKEGTYSITINAMNGEMKGIEEIPAREQGFLELTKETFNDLKKPSAWLHYSKGLAVETGRAVKKTAKKAASPKPEGPAEVTPTAGETAKPALGLHIFSNRWVIFIIILLALLIIYLALIR